MLEFLSSVGVLVLFLAGILVLFAASDGVLLVWYKIKQFFRRFK